MNVHCSAPPQRSVTPRAWTSQRRSTVLHGAWRTLLGLSLRGPAAEGCDNRQESLSQRYLTKRALLAIYATSPSVADVIGVPVATGVTGRGRERPRQGHLTDRPPPNARTRPIATDEPARRFEWSSTVLPPLWQNSCERKELVRAYDPSSAR